MKTLIVSDSFKIGDIVEATSSILSATGRFYRLKRGDRAKIISKPFKYNFEIVVNIILEGESIEDVRYYIPIHYLKRIPYVSEL